jgi:hypothetical protein
MSRALVTLALGDPPEGRWSLPLMERYARRHRLELIVLRQRVVRRGPWWRPRQRACLEKLQLWGLLERHERALYCDLDVLISPRAPDLFALSPPDELGVVQDNVGPEAWKRAEEMERAQWRLGPLPGWDGRYFNGGVILASRAHRALFDPAQPLPGGRWPEQTALNHRAVALGLRRRFLPAECNLTAMRPEFHDEACRRRAWLIHYAGLQNRRLMEADARALQSLESD